MLFFWMLGSSKNSESHCLHNILSITTLFNIDMKKPFLSIKSELFLKDHVALKTGVKAAENSALLFTF